MEGLEDRQLLNAASGVPDVPNEPLNTFDGPRNVGTVTAFSYNEQESSGEIGENDTIFTAELLPLGTGSGQEDTIDVRGAMPIDPFGNLPGNNPPVNFISDLDVYAFDLRAGDILDIAAFGAVGSIDVSYANGNIWFATDTLLATDATDPTLPLGNAIFYPNDSPLQTLGDVGFAQVVPEDGRYYLTLSPGSLGEDYTVGLRVYRPVAEQLPIGSQQIVFLDFDGAVYPRNVFTDLTGVPQTGIVRVPSFAESLADLGFEPLTSQNAAFRDAIENELIDKIIDEVELQFASIAKNGNNGDYDATGIAGQYGLTVLNSRDHADPGLTSAGLNQITTRLLIGGTVATSGQDGALGVSSTIDIGNFSMDDITIVLLDGILASATALPISNSVSTLDAVVRFVSTVITHEAAHSFGIYHTNGQNSVGNIIDGVGPNRDAFIMGVGNDGIFGTSDDMPIEFVTDEFDLTEGSFGFERVPDALANTLVTGTVGSATTGFVFNDLNRNGSRTGDPGLAGVTVFADFNGNGSQDSSEPAAVSGADGSFSLGVPAGTYNIIAIPPTNFSATTATSVSASSGTSNISFGFTRVSSDITGTVYADTNGNGARDAGEGPIADAYVYIDLDGDKRPDLGEPNANAAADGTYSLVFPGPGTYTICIVVPPGFEQTEPAAGTTHTITFDGSAISANANFGLLPSTDFGDAPEFYGAASHGIVAGLSLGSVGPDRELISHFSALATGDDTNGIDDEDGVTLTSPLGIGGTTTFNVTATNTTGTTAFLEAYIDLDGDGNFTDLGERFISSLAVASSPALQTIPISVTVPASASVGTTFARFRLSQATDVGPTGFTSAGEVEDYSFSILPSTDLANDDPDPSDPDSMTVSRNSTSNILDVLANDFQAAGIELEIINLDLSGAVGQIAISGDRKAVLYTPPNGFVGSDSFSYTVRDNLGNTSTADVTVTVRFQSEDPIAVDDSFDVPQNSSNRPLNVLANDVPSTVGGITVVSVTSGSAGGNLSVSGGGQTIRYTPTLGFAGTEQFTYTIRDGAGKTSSATGTVHVLPGAGLDDIIDFTFELLDSDGNSLSTGNNNITPSVRVGDTFQLRVSVDDLRVGSALQGVASASLDVLYSAALVAVRDAVGGQNNDLPFNISFGPNFGGLQAGNANTPGLLDDVGAIQPTLSSTDQQQHSGPAELFTVSLQAVAPGIAQFTGDPSEDQLIETTFIGGDVGLTPSELGYDRTEILILPRSDNFTAAVEDVFLQGVDSNGVTISGSNAASSVLRVLDNDRLRIVNGQPASITQFGLVASPTLGTAQIDDNGTPTNFNDDFITYRPFTGSNGVDQFSYVIVDDEGSASIAQVSVLIGNQNPIVSYDFRLVDDNGNVINANDPVSVGDRVGVQIEVENLQSFGSAIFAGFLDVLYTTDVLAPVPATSSASIDCTDVGGRLANELDFVACIGGNYAEDAVSGAVTIPGLINEFGTLARALVEEDLPLDVTNPAQLATIYFDVIAPGTARVDGSPADRLPESDTLVFGSDDPVDIPRISYDSISFQATGSSLQNSSFPQDVDADGEATALDALIIVNRLGALASGESPLDASDGYFTDVNGDFKVTAVDALQVINYISQVRSHGEAEAVAAPAGEVSSADEPQQQNDAALAALTAEDDDKIVASESSSGQSPLASPIIMDTDDDDDDGLDLFADDVLGQWN